MTTNPNTKHPTADLFRSWEIVRTLQRSGAGGGVFGGVICFVSFHLELSTAGCVDVFVLDVTLNGIFIVIFGFVRDAVEFVSLLRVLCFIHVLFLLLIDFPDSTSLTRQHLVWLVIHRMF